MKKATPYRTIIHVFEAIFYKIALSILHKRVKVFHANSCQSLRPYANNLKQPLLECIDEIIESNKNRPAAVHIDKIHKPEITSRHIPEKYNIAELHVVSKKNVGELSKYFNSKNTETVLNSSIEKRLEHSIWEHIHAIVRYARQGNNRNARIHTDIADTACKELSHFMDEHKYKVFVMEIETYLDALRSQ